MKRETVCLPGPYNLLIPVKRLTVTQQLTILSESSVIHLKAFNDLFLWRNAQDSPFHYKGIIVHASHSFRTSVRDGNLCMECEKILDNSELKMVLILGLCCFILS